MKITLCALNTKAGATLTEQIETLKRSGISLVEFEGLNGVNVVHMKESDLVACRAAFDAAGITVYALATNLGDLGIGDAQYRQNEYNLLLAMRAGHVLGTNRLRVFLNAVTPEQAENPGNAYAIMVKTNRFSHLADGFSICAENAPGHFGDTEDRMTYSLDRLYLIRSVFNPANYLKVGKSELAAAIKNLLPRAEYVRVNNAKENGAFASLSEGDCDWKALLGKIRKDAVLSLSSACETDLSKTFVAEATTLKEMLSSLGYAEENGAWVK